jgi:hypothetical protein
MMPMLSEDLGGDAVGWAIYIVRDVIPYMLREAALSAFEAINGALPETLDGDVGMWWIPIAALTLVGLWKISELAVRHIPGSWASVLVAATFALAGLAAVQA